jgi:hypothetical protein
MQSNVYCIWYPPGGFGHFVNAVISLHGHNFVKSKQKLIFSKKGNSHKVDFMKLCWIPRYTTLGFEFEPDKNYSVLIDYGIDDKNEQFRESFPTSQIIKICYSDQTWPIVASTMIHKAMRTTLDAVLKVDNWQSTEPWAQREKYFLFLRDHDFRFLWRSHTNGPILCIDDMLDYKKLYNTLESYGIELDDFKSTWQDWRTANNNYIEPIVRSQSIMQDIRRDCAQNLNDITDLWTQAVVYYFIWLEFGIEVPHNDYANWFTTTKEIAIMLKDHGVQI